MSGLREVAVDGEVIAIDLGDMIKLQFGTSVVHPGEGRVVRAPAVIVTMSTNGLARTVQAIQGLLADRAKAKDEAGAAPAEPTAPAPAEQRPAPTTSRLPPDRPSPSVPVSPVRGDVKLEGDKTLVRPSAKYLNDGTETL